MFSKFVRSNSKLNGKAQAIKKKLTIQAKTNVNWPKEAFYSKSNGVLSKYDKKNANAHWIKTA